MAAPINNQQSQITNDSIINNQQSKIARALHVLAQRHERLEYLRFYEPITNSPGGLLCARCRGSWPPYGKAWGHYKKKHRKQWDTIVLADDDVVNLVHVRFLSDYYGVPPDRVLEARGIILTSSP